MLLNKSCSLTTKYLPISVNNLKSFHTTSRSSSDHVETDAKEQSRPDLTVEGPSLGDFIAGVIPRGETFASYEGKLKREKGENDR